MDSLALLRFGRSSDSVAPFVLPTNPLELEQIASSEFFLTFDVKFCSLAQRCQHRCIRSLLSGRDVIFT